MMANIAKTINLAFAIFVYTYSFGLIWYRLSDFLIINLIWKEEPRERFWVYEFGLKDLDGEEKSISDQLVITMYFMLTTISTVGYGDYYPTSIGEKFLGIVFQIIGVTIIASVQSTFI